MILFNPGDDHPNCFKGEKIPMNGGAASTEVQIKMVSSREELYSLTSFDMTLSASYSFAKGGVGLSSLDSVDFHQDSLTWVISFKTTYGAVSLRNMELQEAYKNLSTPEIKSICSPEIVTKELKGVGAIAILTVHHLSESKKHQFETKFNVSAKGSLWSAKMQGEYKSLLQTAMATSDISFIFEAIGGPGISKLGTLIGGDTLGEEAFVNYLKIPSILSNYISGLNIDQSTAIQYQTTPTEKLMKAPVINSPKLQNDQLQLIYSKYLTYSATVKRIYSLLQNQNQEMASLKEDLPIYEDAVDILYRKGKECFHPEAKCYIPKTPADSLSIKWPNDENKMDKVCEEERLRLLKKGLIDEGLYKATKRRNLVPIFKKGATSFSEIIHCQDYYNTSK